jgi:hypothetical protein
MFPPEKIARAAVVFRDGGGPAVGSGEFVSLNDGVAELCV